MADDGVYGPWFKAMYTHYGWTNCQRTDNDLGSSEVVAAYEAEKNNPKGHLAKAGHYLVCRYVLGTSKGGYTISERGDVVWIWEVRFGYLAERHFNISNTAGDSGKTAVVNADGMTELKVVYFDKKFSPYTERSEYMKRMTGL